MLDSFSSPRGHRVRLTPTGGAVGEIIGVSPADWTLIHRQTIHSTLAEVLPRAGTLQDTGLGGASAKDHAPDDIRALRD